MTNSVFPKLAGRAVWLVGLVIATLCWTAAGPPASAGWWKPFHDCTSPAYGDGDGTGVAHAALDCKVPLHSGTVVCKSDSTSAYCTSYGNNVSCQGHPTDNFTCSAGAYHYCYQGEGTTTDFRCLLIVLQRAPSSCSSNPPIEQGNPVDITTGTKLERVTDWTSGGNHPLEFSRHYASSFGLLRAPAYSRLGKAWRSNFDARAAYALSPGITIPADAVSGDRLHFVLPDAIEYSFRLSGGVWKPVLPRPHATSPNLVYWDLYRTDIDVSVTVLATSVELRVQDGTRYMFDLDGLLTRIVFPDGYEQGLAYAGGLNTQVTDSFGRRLRFVYDPDLNREGLLSAVLTDDGKRLSFTFQNRAQPPVPQTTIAPDYWALASVIYPDDTPATDTDNPKRSYEYLNDASYPFALTGVFDERGVRYGTWTYDTKGRALSSEHAGGADHYSFQYDDVNNKVTVTNPLGRDTVYSFQVVQGQIRRLTAVDGIATANCAASNTAYAYDSNGFRSQATDAEGRITKWLRNARGLPTSTTEGFGSAAARTTTTSWDAARPLPTQVVQPGLTSDIAYNAAGQVTSISQTDTTTTTIPYSTTGQTRTVTYGYSTITLPAPPPVGPTGSPLSDVPLSLVNPDASSGTTGWTNTTGAIATRTAAPCSTADPCFTGGTSATAVARQDIAIPALNTAEVDSGLRAATIAWRQNSYQDTDTAVVRLLFLDQAGAGLGSAASDWRSVVAWTDRTRTMPVPAGTRTIRVEMMMYRNNGTNNDGYVDAMALTLVADGAAAARPFLRPVNPDALGGTLSGWTVGSGSLTALTGSPCNIIRCFKDNSLTTDRMSQDIVVPADRYTEIDGGARGLELRWFDRASDSSNRTRAEISFLDAADAPLAGTAAVSPDLASVNDWRSRILYGDMPAGTRKVRLTFQVTHQARTPVNGAYFSGISAQLVARQLPQGQVSVLTTADGPLAGPGDTVSYQYDATGNLIQVTDELGHTTQITARNAIGQPLTVVDENGVASTLAYDARGRLITVTVNPGAVQAVTALEYDAAGEITKVTAPDGSFLAYSWSDAKRLTTVTNTAGETIEYGYNGNGDRTATTVKAAGGAIVRQQSALFDELGRLMRQIGASAQQWNFAYDRTDNLTGVTDPRSNLYSYAYDSLQRLIRETDQESAQVNLTRDGQDQVTGYSDPRSIVTAYVRNGFGEVIQEASPDAGTSIYVRDARGLVTQNTDGRGIVSNLAYDNAGRLLSVAYPSAPAENVAYSYDAISGGNKGIGRLTGISDQSGSTSWVYDALGRITAETRVIGTKSYQTSYAYDAAGNVTQIVYPSGRSVSYSRNALGQVTMVTTQASPADPVYPVASGIAWQPMSNLLSSLTHGNGLTTSATYDLDYRIASLMVQDGATLISSLSYGYGDGINLTAVNDNVAPGNSVSLGYSPANRLGSASGPWGNASYSYDGTGNRLSNVVTLSGTTTTRLQSYGATDNRITGMTENGASLRSYTHDGNGNILTDTRPGETFAFTYNARNRPVTVTRNSAAYASYGYNALEQLVSRSTAAPGGPSGTIHYLHDLQGHLIAEADGATGTITREYLWMGDLPIGLVQGGSLYLVHSDHLARPIRVTDASRATVWQASYTPWGEPQAISGTLALDLRFPGQLFQIETGLAYNWHRHYDPTTSRYTQPDPLRFVDGPSVYAYAGSSPFVNVDESGQEYWPIPVAPGGFVLPDGTAKGIWQWWWGLPSHSGAIGTWGNPQVCPDPGYVPSIPPLLAEKAPGKPGPEDGYFPPKNWDGKKVKNPNGSGSGYPDRKGHVWIPEDHKGTHAPHWDVQEPSGNHRPVYPK